MSRRRTSPLKPLLNQIRSWAQQGRTDAWIGHQLDVSPSAIAEFRAEQGIVRAKPTAAELGEAEPEGAPRREAHGPVSLDSVADLLDAELAARPPRREAAPPETAPVETAPAEPAEPKRRRRRSTAKTGAAGSEAPAAESEQSPEPAPAEVEPEAAESPDGAKRRRRRRSGGRAPAEPAPEVAAETVEASEAASEPAPAEPAAPEPGAETPAPRRRRRTAAEREPAPAAAADTSRVEGRLTRTLSLELDAALLDDPVFREHWLAVRDVVAEVRAGEIVLRPR